MARRALPGTRVARNTILLIAIAALLVAIGVLIYRSHNSPNRLNVEPHAQHEIDKAKRK